MHAIRAFIRSHLYAAHAPPRATPDASRPRTLSIAARPDRTSHRRRTRALTTALVRALRSFFDPRHHGVHTARRAPVSG
jgi:hypothetical protein